MNVAGVRSDDLWSESWDDAYCYLTTGRRTGRPHTIEIWFGLDAGSLFLLSGGGDRSDWVRNLLLHPEVTVRLGERSFRGRARIVDDPTEDALARRLLASKYQGWTEGARMSGWARTSLAVAVDLGPQSGPDR